ncbi:quaternary ammonium compound-resistance protein SugE/paired small multidrug resistance pump [Thermosporothrix hazakensis]|jgi:multidrug transporter EmrE-like cation transporter|uniref:Quaternary ammonium compound-resistance protein SugE/paired small multidrug resistance pump n=1 Tax=Thermosporothrix hazakensis TaxID=644383 RepID=A0A326U1Z2_THEHA|nr:quaternary ammonium compound-resistance protein SugE/paired small multidrug resistance pump [Thermosporothrix hazakensis]
MLEPGEEVKRGILVSFSLLTKAMQEIPLSVAYTVWTGIDSLGAAPGGMIFFHEPRSRMRMWCMVGIVSTIAALKLAN